MGVSAGCTNIAAACPGRSTSISANRTYSSSAGNASAAVTDLTCWLDWHELQH